MSETEKKQLSTVLGAVSSNLRRVSSFSQDKNHNAHGTLIANFLNDSDQFFRSLPHPKVGLLACQFNRLTEEFNQLNKTFPKKFKTDKSRAIWSEDALTLSLRLFHLSQALLKS